MYKFGQKTDSEKAESFQIIVINFNETKMAKHIYEMIISLDHNGQSFLSYIKGLITNKDINSRKKSAKKFPIFLCFWEFSLLKIITFCYN